MRWLLVVWAIAAPARAEVNGRVWSGDEPAGRAAVLLDPVAPPVEPAAPGRAKLDEVWTSFVPKVQVVATGSTLLLKDRDDESHTVHAWYGKETLFNRASVPNGEAQRLVLDRPGIVTVTCDLHAEMRAFIVVSPSRYAAVTDLDGRFSLAAPPGSYRVRVWRPGGGDGDSPRPGRDLGVLEVGAGELTLRLPPIAPPVAVAPAAPPPAAARAAEAPPRLPDWMRRLGDRQPWPSGGWATALSIVGVPLGLALAWLIFFLTGRREGSVAGALMLGCGLAFLLGALVTIGLAGAVATALGFGTFLGTILLGAHRVSVR